MDNMLQRQIVIKALGTVIDVEELVRIKYAGTSFHCIDWMLISVNVTIYRTISIQGYQGSSHYIMMALN